MTNHRRVLNIVVSSLRLVAVFGLIALWAGPVAAQSGRRAPRSSAPVPTPTPQDTPVAKPAAETRAALSFIVGIDRVANFSNIPMYLYDSVLRACAERLDDSPSVKVNIANREMNRGEAIKRAKAETDSHIVWIQLGFDNNARGRGDEDLREVYIDYWVFAPTAKIITNGRSYQQAYRGGGVIVMPRPGGRASLPYTEQLLKQAARGAAERILSAMDLPGRNVPGAGSLEFRALACPHR
ncbi:MAG: hypothetical protein ACR2IB_04965 [Pyrinomonadaceae bacterium]